MAFCNQCGTQIPDGATVCAACSGRTVVTSAPAAGLTDNVAGMLAYITIIPAIIFLVMEPYNRSRFIRFHSFQCLFLAAAAFVAHVLLSMLAVIPFMVLLTLPLHLLVNQGQMYKLPVIGDLAEKQANA
jgi:uncharacterized membrane protein